jgi:hypothetical protein
MPLSFRESRSHFQLYRRVILILLGIGSDLESRGRRLYCIISGQQIREHLARAILVMSIFISFKYILINLIVFISMIEIIYQSKYLCVCRIFHAIEALRVSEKLFSYSFFCSVVDSKASAVLASQSPRARTVCSCTSILVVETERPTFIFPFLVCLVRFQTKLEWCCLVKSTVRVFGSSCSRNCLKSL